MSTGIFKLAPGIQDYAWGKKGSASLAARLAAVSVPGFQIDDEKTYAEVRPALAFAATASAPVRGPL